jgi:cellulase
MIQNGNVWKVKIPSALKAGNYVLRHETIALHEGDRSGKAQNYPQCINIVVSGGGSDAPEGVLGMQLYQKDGPGVSIPLRSICERTLRVPDSL